MVYNIVLLASIVIVLVLISVSDIRKRIIPNTHLAMLAVLSILIGSQYYTAPFLHNYIFLIIILLVIYHFRWLAGGDVKLIAVLALALPNFVTVLALWLTMILGGVLAVIRLSKYRFNLISAKNDQRGLPYGVAISIGFCLPLIYISI
ncbi:Type IV leader peptidase family protein [Vibrio mediterranei]|jgi:prepilin peptidase CpaA|uniref:Pilus assembly protein CpaA n=1 Tax=Vibrio mediterranei TaxID=689 RepID=A0ABX5DBQ5_9VIBR|nr:prepilin peptidase [Vibrio mediterranei]PCD86911.1 pilus assembly protein CpaA [Vibrio mediterranei]PRQ66317.1 pilus assembly protein CpaA [Vibrio mediterranei]PTC04052.1 pilus assembly protein CpaA [Vibrio mediterranei]SBO11810.1 Type IV leader peptidase family protein [Vibrio mediterranei]